MKTIVVSSDYLLDLLTTIPPFEQVRLENMAGDLWEVTAKIDVLAPFMGQYKYIDVV